MITAARVNDQELAVAAELAGVDDPAVARRHDLAAVPRLQHEALGLAAVLGLLAEREHAPALRRQRQQALGLGERHGRLDAARRQHRHALAARRQHNRGVALLGGERAGAPRLVAGARRPARPGGGRRRQPRSPARRCRARSSPATSLSSLEISSLRSETLLEISAAAWRTWASSAWRSASDWRLVSCKPASRVRASLSRAVSARSFSPSVRMLVMTRTRSSSCSDERLGLAAELRQRRRQQHGAAHHGDSASCAASPPSPAADFVPCAAWRRAAPRSSRGAPRASRAGASPARRARPDAIRSG